MKGDRPFRLTTAQRFAIAKPIIEEFRECAEDYLDRIEAYLTVKGLEIPHLGITRIGWKVSEREFMMRSIIRLQIISKEMISMVHTFNDEENTLFERKSVIRYFCYHQLTTAKIYDHILWLDDIEKLDIELYTIISQKREEITALKNKLGNAV